MARGSHLGHRKHCACNYCGEPITGAYEREKVDNIIAHYHLDCFYRAKEEHQLLKQLMMVYEL